MIITRFAIHVGPRRADGLQVSGPDGAVRASFTKLREAFDYVRLSSGSETKCGVTVRDASGRVMASVAVEGGE